MAIQELIDLDQRVQLVNSNYDKIDFNIEEYEDQNRVVANIGGHRVPVKTPQNLEKFAQAFGVPYKFVGDVSQELTVSIFDELKNKNMGENFNWLIDPENESLVSYSDSRKPYIPFTEVGKLLDRRGFSTSGSISREGVGTITGTHEVQNTVEPRRGDIVQSGVNIQYSPTMDNPPQVLPWSLRLVCTNGMTSQQNRERIKIVSHDMDDILEQIDFQIEKQFEYANQINERFAHLVSHNVNPVDYMQNIINSYRVPKRQRDLLLAMAAGLGEEERTAYDVVNVFTEFARDIFDRGNRLGYQAIAGDIVESNHLTCHSCGSELD